MIREIDLLAYLPPTFQEYHEIREVTATENPEFQLLWDADELIRNNIFFLTANEQGLKRFEKIVGLTPLPNDTFTLRQMRVFTRWNDELPYTLRHLIGLLEVLTDGDYEMEQHFDDYSIEITTHLGAQGAIEALEQTISETVPANLIVTLNNVPGVIAAGNGYIGATITPSTFYSVTNSN